MKDPKFDAERMGRVSTRMRIVFVLSCVAFLVALAISPVRNEFSQWKRYQTRYTSFAQGRPDTKVLLASYHSGVDQIWLPDLKVVDRCTSCHLGISEPSLRDASVPQPFRAHPPIPHSVKEWGCTVCHQGQGRATEVAEAHETTLSWERPILPVDYIQASCGSCHHDDIPQTAKLNRGRQLLTQLNCSGCHKIEGIQRPEMLGPDLSNVANKVTRQWIFKWLKEPRTEVDASGTTTVNGYLTQDEPRMPKFNLSDEEITNVSAYLGTLKQHSIEPYKFDAKLTSDLDKRPDLTDQGEARFREMFCTTCHSLAVTRGDETKLIGGTIGPELTKVASKVNRDWLVAWLRDPNSQLPHAMMPRYQWTDEDLYKVTSYINAKLSDPDLLTDVPQMDDPTEEQIAAGKRLFTDKGCISCHAVEGSPAQKDFGPDLSNLGSKNASQLEFGASTIPKNIVSYINAKITDPQSVNTAARMPRYRLTADDLQAITTALLSLRGDESRATGFAKLSVHKPQAEFDPAGQFGAVYRRYRCDVCHKFNGFGGDLAPDLSYEGSRAQRQWIISFLKAPQTLRPALLFRMPQFNMTDQEAGVLADYLTTANHSPSVDWQVDQTKYTPDMAAEGKQLYELKYQCQACHTIGSSGGYVGPNLSNAGNWLTPGWIEGWLRNPQALVPGTIEPRRTMTDQEIHALTAYLITLKQSVVAAAGQPGAPKGAGQ